MTKDLARARFFVCASIAALLAFSTLMLLMAACAGANGDPAPTPDEASTDTGVVPCTTATTTPTDGGAG